MTSETRRLQSHLYRFDRRHCRCFYPFFAHGHENSPCVENAPALTQFFEYSPYCETISDQKSCSMVDQCLWFVILKRIDKCHDIGTTRCVIVSWTFLFSSLDSAMPSFFM